MNFRPELAQAILDGRKTETRRLLSDNPNSPWWKEGCAYKVGRDYAVCPGRGKQQVGRLKVLDVFKASLGEMTEADARAEGADSLREFTEEIWTGLHGDFDPDLEVWVVRFERFYRYTVVSPSRHNNPLTYRFGADDLGAVRAVLTELGPKQAHRCWVIDNSDPTGVKRVALEDVP